MNDPKDGGRILCRNIGKILSGHTALQALRRLISSSVFFILFWCEAARVIQT